MDKCNWGQSLKAHMAVVIRACNHEDLCKQMENAYCTISKIGKGCFENKAPKNINKFRKLLHRFITLCHTVNHDLYVKSEYSRLVTYEDLLSAVLSRYIDVICNSSCLNVEEKCSNLSLNLFLFLGTSPLHLLNAILMSEIISSNNVHIHVDLYKKLIKRLPSSLDDKCFLRLLILTKHLLAHLPPEQHHEINIPLRQISVLPEYEQQILHLMTSCNIEITKVHFNNPISLLMSGKLKLWKKLFKIMNEELASSLETLVNFEEAFPIRDDMSQSTSFFLDRKASSKAISSDVHEEIYDMEYKTTYLEMDLLISKVDKHSQFDSSEPSIRHNESTKPKKVTLKKKAKKLEKNLESKTVSKGKGRSKAKKTSKIRGSVGKSSKDKRQSLEKTRKKSASKRKKCRTEKPNAEESVDMNCNDNGRQSTTGQEISPNSYNESLLCILKKADNLRMGTLRQGGNSCNINEEQNQKLVDALQTTIIFDKSEELSTISPSPTRYDSNIQLSSNPLKESVESLESDVACSISNEGRVIQDDEMNSIDNDYASCGKDAHHIEDKLEGQMQYKEVKRKINADASSGSAKKAKCENLDQPEFEANQGTQLQITVIEGPSVIQQASPKELYSSKSSVDTWLFTGGNLVKYSQLEAADGENIKNDTKVDQMKDRTDLPKLTDELEVPNELINVEETRESTKTKISPLQEAKDDIVSRDTRMSDKSKNSLNRSPIIVDDTGFKDVHKSNDGSTLHKSILLGEVKESAVSHWYKNKGETTFRKKLKLEDFIDNECTEDNRLEDNVMSDSSQNESVGRSSIRSSRESDEDCCTTSCGMTKSKKNRRSKNGCKFIDDECYEDNRQEIDVSSVNSQNMSDNESSLESCDQCCDNNELESETDAESQLEDSFINDETLSESENNDIEREVRPTDYRNESTLNAVSKYPKRNERKTFRKRIRIESSCDDDDDCHMKPACNTAATEQHNKLINEGGDSDKILINASSDSKQDDIVSGENSIKSSSENVEEHLKCETTEPVNDIKSTAAINISAKSVIKSDVSSSDNQVLSENVNEDQNGKHDEICGNKKSATPLRLLTPVVCLENINKITPACKDLGNTVCTPDSMVKVTGSRSKNSPNNYRAMRSNSGMVLRTRKVLPRYIYSGTKSRTTEKSFEDQGMQKNINVSSIREKSEQHEVEASFTESDEQLVEVDQSSTESNGDFVLSELRRSSRISRSSRCRRNPILDTDNVPLCDLKKFFLDPKSRLKFK